MKFHFITSFPLRYFNNTILEQVCQYFFLKYFCRTQKVQ
uniref:Uncharacterized protein n=1 Tax=Podoviridae sp. ctP1X6 TaxID=2825246 RepID=A0A8S5U458_9CAUD|nr:MAG TPA: hypothetical protein [Podoviridae sp. ctP1X6]